VSVASARFRDLAAVCGPALILCCLLPVPAAGQDPVGPVSPGGSEPQLIDRIVAIVDQEMILQSDLERELELYVIEARYAGREITETEAEVREEILARLIETKLIIAAAKQEEISVEDEVVQQGVEEKVNELVQHLGSEDNLKRELLNSGMTLEDYRSRLATQLRDQHYLRAVISRFIRPQVEVLENEIADYYQEHLADMPATPDSLTLANILIPVQPAADVQREIQAKIARALQELEEGQPFATVAKSLSEGPNAQRGGSLGVVKRGDLFDRELEVAVFALEEGRNSLPIVTTRGVHIIHLDAITTEGRAISQIFFPLTVTEEDVAAARKLAEAAHARLLAGEPFSTVATEVSSDPASAHCGGDLGTFRLEDLSAQFQDHLRDTKAGEVTEPLLTPAGFYIFLLKERTYGRTLSFAEVKGNIRRLLESQKLDAELVRYVKSLRSRFFVDQKG